jgi:2-polyprenyl-3-methyl-5-hydroxy-6-metoxy-1,4-benzoquinol methylase
MNPRFNQKIINDFYNENYYKGNAEYSYYDEREAEKYSLYVWRKRLKIIKNYSQSGNLLDVGCAFGGFLKAAADDFEPYGIELSEYAGNYAKVKFGKNIHVGTLDDHPFERSFFSVITMIELIEHLNDPASAIKQCYDLLKDDGLLVIQTANMDALQAKIFKERYAYFMPGHLSYFTKKNLCVIIKKSGFTKIKVFQPVEFGLMPKLLKSRYNFDSRFDYYKWIRIALYHYLSKIRLNNFAATSSMVIYAVK